MAGFVLLAVTALLLTEDWARGQAAAAGRRAAADMAATHAGLLASELQRYRLLPVVLAEDREVEGALRGDAGARDRLDRKLEGLARNTDASVIYLLDARGIAIAASNWRLPTSFVGHDYGYRSYFAGAVADGRAEQFALGAVSGRPGLFLSRKAVGAVPGVVVVKVEFAGVEREWRNQPGLTLVSDAAGLVTLTNRPEARFNLTLPLAEEAMRQAQRQFGSAGLKRLPLETRGDVAVGAAGTRYVAGMTAVPIPGWRLRYFEPLAPLERAALAEARMALLAAVLLMALFGAVLLRAHERRSLQRIAREQLEAEVRSRTAELHATNARLRDEIGQREDVDRRLRQANGALAQANRLASLGQITAGVAHEINQPVAAIQTFSENAVAFLARGEQQLVTRNLGRIVELTGRIGRITAELRAFARRGVPSSKAAMAVEIDAALDGALLLIGDRVRSSKVRLVRAGAKGARVRADQIRLEQIVINLVGNALDALDGRDGAIIRIETRRIADSVTLTIADNGPGIDRAIAETLFTPFTTTRPDGLGLGLGIARDIARELGGDLALAKSPIGGAAFVLKLAAVD